MKTILSTVFVLLTCMTWAQSGQVKGRVLDQDNFPLPGATVMALNSGVAAISNFDGYFTLTSIPAGEDQIIVSYVGFESKTQSVAVSDGQTSYLEFNLSASVNELNEVVVSGFQAGINKALNKQRTDINVTNVISSDQVGKFPDANIGDALRRVPGISMQNDQGEARDIIIRGFAPGLNSVTLNGERIPSAEGDNRRVQMDLIPSDMIQTIEVNKSLTPDMEGDAIGGSVNLITRSNPNRFRFSATGSYGLNAIRDGYNGAASFIVADKVSDKFRYTLSSSLQTNDYGSDNIEFVWNNPEDWAADSPFDEHDIRRYDVKRTRRSISANLDYALNNNHQFYIKSMYNNRDDWENRFRLRMAKFDVEDNTVRVRKQTKGGIDNDENQNRRLEAQSTYKIALGGDHQFGNLALSWKASTSKADEQRPNERYIRFEQKNVPISAIDISDPKFPVIRFAGDQWNDVSAFNFNEATEQNGLTEETDQSLRVDFKLPLAKVGTFKFGGKYKDKEKLRDNNFFDFSDYIESRYETMADVATLDYTVSDYLPGSDYQHGFFATPKFLGDVIMPPSEGVSVLEEFITSNYNAKEAVTAAYGMLTSEIGDKTKVIAGARFEQTAIEYTGYGYTVEEDGTERVEELTGSGDYGNFLPSVTVQHELTDDIVLNAAYTTSLARPGYFNIVPFRSIIVEDQQIEEGNPELEATVSQNFDFTAEKYMGSVGLISLGVFHKNMDNWLYTYTTTEYDYGDGNDWTYSQVRNGRTASVTGFEVSLQSKLKFLPGFLSNLTYYGNYTFTDSSTDGVDGREDIPLVGAVQNMFNSSLAYETKKMFVRASLNYSGEALDEVGGAEWEDRYYDQQLFVDLNASYALSDSVRLFAEMKNLTNQPLRYYQGIAERTMQLEYYNYSWNAGVKIDF